MFEITFNAAQVAPNTAPDPVPSDTYTVAIIKTEEVGVKDTPGASFYKFTMQILDGEHKGKTIIERLNCKNPNQQAVDIAYSTLSAICRVAGVMNLGRSSQELHGKPFKVDVVKIPRNDRPDIMTNEIRGYRDMAGKPPSTDAAGNTATTTTNTAFAEAAATTTAPAVPAAPAAPSAPAVAPTFPPEGWIAHPQAPGYFYKGQEVVTEEALRKMMAAPAAPTAPAVPAAPDIAAAAATGGDGVPDWAK